MTECHCPASMLAPFANSIYQNKLKVGVGWKETQIRDVSFRVRSTIGREVGTNQCTTRVVIIVPKVPFK